MLSPCPARQAGGGGVSGRNRRGWANGHLGTGSADASALVTHVPKHVSLFQQTSIHTGRWLPHWTAQRCSSSPAGQPSTARGLSQGLPPGWKQSRLPGFDSEGEVQAAPKHLPHLCPYVPCAHWTLWPEPASPGGPGCPHSFQQPPEPHHPCSIASYGRREAIGRLEPTTWGLCPSTSGRGDGGTASSLRTPQPLLDPVE